MKMLNQNQINQILQIAKEAGDLIMEYYLDRKDSEISLKQDDSPVTKADLSANNLIIKGLKNLFSDVAIVSEENKVQENIIAAKENQYFMIDPLDGTSSFVKKSDEFTVNIALIKNSKPIFGVIYVPVKDLIYFTNENSQSVKISDFSNPNLSKSQEIHVTHAKNNLKVICTRREPEKSQIIDDLKNRNVLISEIVSVASSYKFCLIAEGVADLYVRRVNIKAWDVAAGHAIINGAGGNMIDLTTNQELKYDLADDFSIPIFEVS